MDKEIVLIIGIISVLLFVISIILIILATKRVSTTEKNIEVLREELKRTRNTLNSGEMGFGTLDQKEFLADFKRRLETVEKKQDNNLDRIDIVRYFASDSNEGRSSYSVGITNAKKDGLVLTALMYRSGMNMYVKKIEDGVSDIPLSKEEKEAVSRSKITEVIS